MGTKRKTYTKDFKEDAVRYYRSSGLKLSHIAKELGVDHSTLSRWDNEFDKENAFPGQGNERDKEMARLKRENEKLRERCEILKKAAEQVSKAFTKENKRVTPEVQRGLW